MIRKIIIGVMTVIVAAAVPPLAREALFLGVTDAAGRPAQPELERAIRGAIAANPQWRLIDEHTTRRIIRERESLGYGNMENTIPASFELSDSLLIIRCAAEEPSLKIRRHRLFWGKIDGRMSVNIYLGGANDPNAYRGKVSASSTRVKDLILFRSAPKVVHISAIDRAEMIDEMREKIVKEFSDLTETYLNALARKERDSVKSEVHNESAEDEQVEGESVDSDVSDPPQEESTDDAELTEDR